MFSISKMTKEDITKVAEIEKELFSMPWSYKAFEDSLTLDYAIFFVAKEGQTVCGYAGLYQAMDEGDITNVGVARKYQNKGIANELIDAIKLRASEKKIKTLYLEVRVSNAVAVHLYQKQGFRVIGTRKNFYENPVEDAYVMSLEVISKITYK